MSEVVMVFFDSGCLMCHQGMRLCHQLDEQDVLRFAPLAGETAQRFEVPNRETMVVLKDGESYEMSEAVRVLLREIYPIAGMLLGLIPRCVRDRGYRWLSSNRARFSKLAPACDVPDPSLRAKFLP